MFKKKSAIKKKAMKKDAGVAYNNLIQVISQKYSVHGEVRVPEEIVNYDITAYHPLNMSLNDSFNGDASHNPWQYKIVTNADGGENWVNIHLEVSDSSAANTGPAYASGSITFRPLANSMRLDINHDGFWSPNELIEVVDVTAGSLLYSCNLQPRNNPSSWSTILSMDIAHIYTITAKNYLASSGGAFEDVGFQLSFVP